MKNVKCYLELGLDNLESISLEFILEEDCMALICFIADRPKPISNLT